MRKIILFSLLLTLAVTGAAAQPSYLMTKEEMTAIWQESFDRMQTTGALNLKTLDDLPAFEAEYTANTGRERKDDLVFSSLPMEGDMPYDEALAYAKKLILDKFGTPEEELDAMGVYPRLIDHIYRDHESEWEFYFTPRTHTDIELDHDYEGQGEYRVTFGAQTGTVEYVNWYIDQFFPDYAQRTWDAGYQQYVYDRAGRQDFFTQPVEQQAHFITLFEQAGFDTSALKRTDEELLQLLELDLLFSEPEENLLSSDDALVQTALTALEKSTGLTRAFLQKYSFCALYSPMQRETTDICIAYNYNDESEKYRTGELNHYNGLLYSYATRIGIYMVCIDPATGEAVRVAHLPRKTVGDAPEGDLLLQRADWTAADAAEFDDAFTRLTALVAPMLDTDQPDEPALHVAADTFMRSIGGDEKLYSARGEQPTDIGLTEAARIMSEAVCQVTGLTADELATAYTCEAYYSLDGTYQAYYFTPDLTKVGYFACVDAETGELLMCEESQGNG